MPSIFYLIFLLPLLPVLAYYLFIFAVHFYFINQGANKYASGRYEIIDEPVQPYRWRAKLDAWESELRSMGFTLLHYFHNVQYASEGQPNFTAVYVSSDRLVSVSLYFSLWPDDGLDFSNLDGLTGKELTSLSCHSIFAGPRWVITSCDKGDKSNLPHPFYQYFYPADLSAKGAVEWHLRLLATVPHFSNESPVPYTTAEAYMEQERLQHRVLVNNFYKSRWRLS